MASWLTTHYPHPVPDSRPWDIWLQRDRKNAVDGIALGDQVFFYDYALRKPIKGGGQFSPGRQGIVRIATVSGPIYPRNVPIEHVDGTTAYWSWGVPTGDPDTGGFVKREDVLRILGYKSGGHLRGFNAGKGVKRREVDQARELARLFESRKQP